MPLGALVWPFRGADLALKPPISYVPWILGRPPKRGAREVSRYMETGCLFRAFYLFFVAFLCARASLFEPSEPMWGRFGVLVDLTTILTPF